MPKGTFPLNNFTGGELSPRLAARVDTSKYRNGAKAIDNCIVMPHGGVKKRPGTKFVAEVKDSTQSQRMVPFQFNTEQAYMLEFGPLYVRFYRDGGIVVTGAPATITGITQANPGIITATSHGYSNGDQVIVSGVVGMTEVNNRRFTVANATANTFELSGVNTTGYGAYTSGGSVDKPVEVTTTYTAAEIDDLEFDQSNDKLFIAHRNHPISELTRTSHTAWTLSNTDIRNGPFRSINTTGTGLKVTVDSTATASISGATQANPVVVTFSSAHGFGDGATIRITGVSGMTQLNNNNYVAKYVSDTQVALFDQDKGQPVGGASYGAYTSGGTATPQESQWSTVSPGTPVSITANANLFSATSVGQSYRLYEPAQAIQAGQVINGQVVGNLDRLANDGKVYGLQSSSSKIGAWTQWQSDFQIPTHQEGTVRYNNVENDFGGYATYLHRGFCVIEVTGYTSATSVTGIVRSTHHVPNSIHTASFNLFTTYWQEGAWNPVHGYPSAITFHEKRLWAAATGSDPQTVWSSKTGVFNDFQDGTEDDEGIVINLASGQVEEVKWLVSGQVLFAGTASSIRALKPSGNNAGLTPANVDANTRVRFGTAPAKPVGIGDSLIFAQRRGLTTNAAKKLREVIYSFESDSYPARDLTIISEHITGDTGVEQLSYQPDPDSVAWAQRADGRLAGLTYEREQEVSAWHKHILGGTSAEVQSVGIIPGSYGDDLWLIASRTINGATAKYVEVLTQGLLDDTDREDAIYLDSAATYDGAATSTITGLWHLIGETVDCLVDGAKQTGKTVSSLGAISLDPPGSVVHVGKKYTSVLETMDLEAAAARGTAKSRHKRIGKLFFELYNSLGGRCGRDASNMRDIEYRRPSDVMGSAPSLYTGIKDFEDFEDDAGRDAVIRFEHDEPYPFHVLGIYGEINTAG